MNALRPTINSTNANRNSILRANKCCMYVVVVVGAFICLHVRHSCCICGVAFNCSRCLCFYFVVLLRVGPSF